MTAAGALDGLVMLRGKYLLGLQSK